MDAHAAARREDRAAHVVEGTAVFSSNQPTVLAGTAVDVRQQPRRRARLHHQRRGRRRYIGDPSRRRLVPSPVFAAIQLSAISGGVSTIPTDSQGACTGAACGDQTTAGGGPAAAGRSAASSAPAPRAGRWARSTSARAGGPIGTRKSIERRRGALGAPLAASLALHLVVPGAATGGVDAAATRTPHPAGAAANACPRAAARSPTLLRWRALRRSATLVRARSMSAQSRWRWRRSSIPRPPISTASGAWCVCASISRLPGVWTRQRVVDAAPKGHFEEAAIDAVQHDVHGCAQGRARRTEPEAGRGGVRPLRADAEDRL